MPPTRKNARIAGLLFLIQLIPYYFGHDYILGSILYAPDFLSEIITHKNQVNIAMLLELLSGFAFVGFSVILFQILKKYNPYTALAYVGLRFVEFGIVVFSQIKLMSLVAVSEQLAEAEGNQSLFFQTMGTVLRAEWQWAALVYMIVFCLNALLFYGLLHKSRLVPRFIAVWGFLGALVALMAPLLIMFDQPTGGMLIYAPIGFNELFLAIWLIIIGFNAPVNTSRNLRTIGKNEYVN